MEKALHFGNVGSKFSSKKKSLVEILVDFFWGEWRRCLEVGVSSEDLLKNSQRTNHDSERN